MNLIDGALYKVIEFDNGILILNALDNMMRRPDARELVIADAKTLGEFLVKYLHARSKGAAGVAQDTALKQALEGAIVVRRGDRQ